MESFIEHSVLINDSLQTVLLLLLTILGLLYLRRKRFTRSDHPMDRMAEANWKFVRNHEERDRLINFTLSEMAVRGTIEHIITAVEGTEQPAGVPPMTAQEFVDAVHIKVHQAAEGGAPEAVKKGRKKGLGWKIFDKVNGLVKSWIFGGSD